MAAILRAEDLHRRLALRQRGDQVGLDDRLVALEQRLAFALVHKRERCRQLVMDKHIAGAGVHQAGAFDTPAIVVILEESTAIDFVERADSRVGAARHHYAEERQGRQPDHLAKVAAGKVPSRLRHVCGVGVVDVDPGLVADVVGHRANQAKLGIAL